MNQANSKSKTIVDHPITFQRLAGQWYAFSMVEGEMYFGDIPEHLVLQTTNPTLDIEDKAA